LKLVKTFLDANPNEVLTLLFTNPEGLSIKDVWKPAFDGAGNDSCSSLLPTMIHLHLTGITPLAYVPPSLPVEQSQWPTLGEMIDSGKRVVVFLDAGADDGGVDFILPEFSMVRFCACCHSGI
jgi:hypothetical protein